jgi:hypothetical protein
MEECLTVNCGLTYFDMPITERELKFEDRQWSANHRLTNTAILHYSPPLGYNIDVLTTQVKGSTLNALYNTVLPTTD